MNGRIAGMRKRLYVMFLGAALGLTLFGCGHKDAKLESEEKSAESAETPQETQEEDAGATATPEPTEAVEEEDGSKKEGKYEIFVDEKIRIDGKQEKFQILVNPEDTRDAKMRVGEAPVKLERVSVDAGYSPRVEIEVQDCTGDGKDDIVLVMGYRVYEIQVLTREDGKWKEVPFPEKVWGDDDLYFKRQGKKMRVGVTSTKEEKVIADSSNDEWHRSYRMCKVGKDGRMIIVDSVYRGDDVNNIAGKVKLTMRYDQASKAFKIEKTTFSF